MSLQVDVKYAGMISGYLRNFKRVDTYKYQFSCPFCGDSKTNARKARASLFVPPQGGRLIFNCYNCNYPTTMYNLLHHLDPSLASEYRMDTFLDEPQDRREVKDEKFDFNKKPSTVAMNKSLVKISSLPATHKAKQYVQERHIPASKQFLLYYTPKFRAFCNEIVPETFEDIKFDEDRLILPLMDKHGKVLGYQGRALKESAAKYITVLTNPSNPKIFGLNTTDLNQTMYVFEGPIDSLFIPNGLASAGGRVDTVLSSAGIGPDRSIIVYDNEPRSIHTVEKMIKAVADGFKVCIWPESVKETDVNDMILAGYTSKQIKQMIDANSYKGLMAEAKIAGWRKV